MRLRHALFALGPACWTGPVAPPPANVGAAPAAAPTVALIVELARPVRALELVDPDRGLVFVDAFLEPGEPSGTTSERHLCGAELDRFMHDEWTEVVAAAITGAQDNGSVVCADLACRAGGRGEWDPVFHFDFVRGPRGLALRSISYDDEVLRGQADVAAEHAKTARLVARLAVACK